jgi:hypothetical protein
MKNLKREKLTQERLYEVLDYDPETGIFVWNIEHGAGRPSLGDIAGCVSNANGYRYINIDCHTYRSSRLAFMFMEGYFPEYFVDHKDRVRDNDKWNNLRHATPSCNSRNCKLRKNNKSGVTGVSWHKTSKQWYSNIRADGRPIYLGASKKINEAIQIRWEAEKKYNYPNCQTSSSAYLYLKERGLI